MKVFTDPLICKYTACEMTTTTAAAWRELMLFPYFLELATAAAAAATPNLCLKVFG